MINPEELSKKETKTQEPETQMPEKETKIPEDYLCPITYELMEDPVTTCEGQTYAKTNIKKWLIEEKKNTDPLTGLKLANKNLLPNLFAKQILENFKAGKDAVLDDYLCPITKKIMLNPVLLADGRTCEGSAAVAWLEKNNVSPVDKVKLEHTDIIPNLFAKKVINALKNNPEQLNELLFTAIKNAEVGTVESIIKFGGDIYAKDKEGKSVLFVAAERGEKAIVEIVTAQIPPDDATTTRYDEKYDYLRGENTGYISPLRMVTRKGNFEIVKFLMSKYPQIIYSEYNSWSSLHEAIEHEQEAIAEYFINNGAELDLKNYSLGETPLIRAVKKGYINLVKLMLDKGANIEEESRFEGTSYEIAIKENHQDMAKFLLERGATVYTKKRLFDAVKKGDVSTLDFYIKNGISIDSTNAYGYTIASLAAAWGHLDIIKYLFEHGKDIVQKDQVRDWDRSPITNPLERAVESGHENIVKFFLEKNIDFDIDSISVLAIESRRIETIKLLIAYKKFNFNFKPKYGERVCMLHQSVIHKDKELLKLSLVHMDVNLKDDLGLTALHHAINCAKGNEDDVEIISTLLAHGADLEAETKDGSTALHLAVKPPLYLDVRVPDFDKDADADGSLTKTWLKNFRKERCLKIINVLLENGADYSAKNNNGQSVIQVAYSDIKEEVSQLISNYEAAEKLLAKKIAKLLKEQQETLKINEWLLDLDKTQIEQMESEIQGLKKEALQKDKIIENKDAIIKQRDELIEQLEEKLEKLMLPKTQTPATLMSSRGFHNDNNLARDNITSTFSASAATTSPIGKKQVEKNSAPALTRG